MRSIIDNQGDREIVKHVDANEEVYHAIKRNVVGYRDWLASAALRLVDTAIDYKNGKIYFRQPFLKLEPTDPGIIAEAILKLKFDQFGIDASPNNFLGGGVLVDLYPFLFDEWKVLEMQFDYSYDEIKNRYFNGTSVLSTYLIRLYKIDSQKCLSLLKTYRLVLQKGIENKEVLPRECCRLLKLISLGSGNEKEFSDFYVATKKRHFFSEDDRNELLVLLANG